MSLRNLKSTFGQGGVGLTDQLPAALRQVRATKILPLASGSPSVLPQAVAATSMLVDGAAASTLRLDAVLGGQWGNGLKVTTRRFTQQQTGDLLFDLELFRATTVQRNQDRVIQFAASDVDFSSTPDTITLPRNHKFETGQPVHFTTASALPTGLTAGTIYWVVYVSATKIAVASTKANAFAGTTINLTAAGTGPHKIRDVQYELHSGLSMDDNHARYVETMLLKSAMVRGVDQDSVTADQRPADVIMAAFGGGTGEASLTGVNPGDEILAVTDVTTSTAPTALTATDFAVTDAGKIINAGTAIAVSKGLLFHVSTYGTLD
jgi:hypothetical protein